MQDFFEFYGNRGCFSIAFEIGLFIYAVACAVMGIADLFEWSIIIGGIVDLTVYITLRWGLDKIQKYIKSHRRKGKGDNSKTGDGSLS